MRKPLGHALENDARRSVLVPVDVVHADPGCGGAVPGGRGGGSGGGTLLLPTTTITTTTTIVRGSIFSRPSLEVRPADELDDHHPLDLALQRVADGEVLEVSHRADDVIGGVPEAGKVDD